MQELWQLRAAVARRLSQVYGGEVPAYLTLLEVTQEVNAELGSSGRVDVERHGAIRVGSARELGQVARVFAALGMEPVGFYDLRGSGVPVVSTAFRPVDPRELERNPFRVFTSVLTTDDRRFFPDALAARVHDRLEERELFPAELLALADRATAESSLPDADAECFGDLLAAALQLDHRPIDCSWYEELSAISAVAADIAGVPSTHINHLTPRVLDIEELHVRMQRRGIEMIPEIQGPPAWEGPDVLLRQTSFRALAEERLFREEDGTVVPGQLKVRFGEVEARGIALTREGRDLYDAALQKADAVDGDRVQSLRDRWRETFPLTDVELCLAGLGAFTVSVNGNRADVVSHDLATLVRNGTVSLTPIVYEDFLPRSAAGIFRSNLDRDSTAHDDSDAADYDETWMAQALGRELRDPDDLYADLTSASLLSTEAALGLAPHTLALETTACR